MLYQKRTPYILLVEDDEVIRPMVSRALRGKGYDVIECPNGEEGLKIFNLHEMELDLVLSDINCKGKSAIDGPRLLDAIRGRNSALPFIFMTGAPEDYAEGELEEKSGHKILWKPFTLAELFAAINTALEHYQSSHPARL